MPELPRSPGGKWEAREKRIEEERLAATARMARMRWRRRLLVAIVGANVLFATLGASIVWRSGLTERTVTHPSTPTSTVDAGTSPPSTDAPVHPVFSTALAKEAKAQLVLILEDRMGAANQRLRGMDYPRKCKRMVTVAKGESPRELGFILDGFIRQSLVNAPYPYVEMGSATIKGKDGYYGNVILVSCP